MPGILTVGPRTEAAGTVETPVHIQVFDACCKLWVIFNETERDYQVDNVKTSLQRLEIAEQSFRRLLVWAEDLPLSLVRRDNSAHAVLMMQYVSRLRCCCCRRLLQG